MDDDDLLEMEQCHGVVVASAIFGNILSFGLYLLLVKAGGVLLTK